MSPGWEGGRALEPVWPPVREQQVPSGAGGSLRTHTAGAKAARRLVGVRGEPSLVFTAGQVAASSRKRFSRSIWAKKSQGKPCAGGTCAYLHSTDTLGPAGCGWLANLITAKVEAQSSSSLCSLPEPAARVEEPQTQGQGDLARHTGSEPASQAASVSGAGQSHCSASGPLASARPQSLPLVAAA